MFIATLFINAKIWKQPTCSSTDEWIKVTWQRYLMEYYSAIKEDTILPQQHGWIWRANQTEKDKYCMISLICGI